MSLLTSNTKPLNLQVQAPTSSVSDYQAQFFINGELKTSDYSVKCPVGIKLCYKHLLDRPKLVDLLENASQGREDDILSKLVYRVKVIAGSSYRAIQLSSEVEEIDDPIISRLLEKVSPKEEDYFQMIKVLVSIETKAGDIIQCFPPSFDIPQERVTSNVMGIHALHHHHLVDKEVTFVPTGVSKGTKEEVLVEEDY